MRAKFFIKMALHPSGDFGRPHPGRDKSGPYAPPVFHAQGRRAIKIMGATKISMFDIMYVQMLQVDNIILKSN